MQTNPYVYFDAKGVYCTSSLSPTAFDAEAAGERGWW